MSGGIPISSKKKKPGKNNDKNKKLSGFTIEFDEPFQEPKIVKPEIKVTHSGDFEFEDLFHSSISKDLNDLHISESDSNHEDNNSSNSHYPTLSDINNNNDNNNNNNDNNSIDKFIPSNTKYGLEDFELLKLVGQGGYGKVYQARHKENNEIYAIKLLRKDLIIKSNTVDGTIAEKDILRKIKHPFIVTLHYAFQNEGRLYLVMDFINGGQLFFHLRNQAMFSEELVKFYIAEVVIAVEFLHNNNIIHRDLKPENILIGQGGKSVKVADFGLSLVKDHSLQEREEMKRIRGSPAFMSPEALLGSDLSPKTDVYSFGVILWELITGKSPYDDLNIESFDQLIDEICEKGTREKIPDTVPSSVKKLIEMCWQPTPELRPSFIQIIGQLDDCILETAISDKEGRRMWKRHFGTEPGMLKYDVPWEHFLNVVSMQLKMAPGLKIFQGLKSMVIKHDTNLVSLEEFGNVVKWFGPMLIADEPENNFIYRMQNLLTKRWFHGDITLQEAQTRLAGTEAGTFLIRFSSNPGHFALSKMIENQNKDHVIVHIRISHVPGGKYTFVLDGKVYEYNNLEDLVKSPVLGLTKPCQGSKYYAQFRIKQVHSGYVNTVTS